MRQWILHGPRNLRLEEIHLDTTNLAPDELWVRTEYSTLSTGTDRGNYAGEEAVPGAPIYPRPVGYSNAGRVMRVGSAVTHFAPGDRVFSMKRHQSDYICRESDMLVAIPDGVTSENASLTYLYYLGYYALLDGTLFPGEYVVVVGTGLLGLATIALARAFGARVVALTDMEERRQLASRVGAHRAWLSHDPELPSHLADFTGGIGADLVVLTANPWPAYRAAIESVRPRGRISILSLVGRGERALPFNPLDMAWLYHKSVTIKGSKGGVPIDYPYPLEDGSSRFNPTRGCSYLLQLMAEGAIEPDHLITHRFPYDQAPQAYELAYHRDPALITAVFQWS